MDISAPVCRSSSSKQGTYLDVMRSLDPVNTLESALGDQTSSVTGLGAPRHDVAFTVSNDSLCWGGMPLALVLRSNPREPIKKTPAYSCKEPTLSA
jgi:hypothetical protein